MYNINASSLGLCAQTTTDDGLHLTEKGVKAVLT